MRRKAILFLSLMLTACTRYAPGPAPMLGREMGTLDPVVVQRVESLLEESGMPSMALAVVVGDEVVWAKGLGEQPKLSTIYMIGSIDKAYMTTEVVSQVNDSLIRPEDDVSVYLRFEVRNPIAPDVPITTRLLLHAEVPYGAVVPKTPAAAPWSD